MSLSRFDDLVQTERNFSATLLPLVLFPDDFRGLREFVRLVDERTSWERHADGNAVPREEQETHLPERLDGDYLELITEFHIARDLRAGNQVPPDDDPADERVKKDAPDMVIVLGDEVLVCEAKFIGNWTVDKLATQMASQRAQIARLFVARPALRAYRHVAIVPRLIPLDTDAVVTWQDIACLAKSLPAPKYVTAPGTGCGAFRPPRRRTRAELGWIQAAAACGHRGGTGAPSTPAADPDRLSRWMEQILPRYVRRPREKVVEAALSRHQPSARDPQSLDH